MSDQPKLVLHEVPYSHPCLAVSTALKYHGLDYESRMLTSGPHADEIEQIYGEGKRSVPGLLIDDEPVHGTADIFARLDAMIEDAGLYPDESAAALREAEAGLAEDLQTAARVLTFGALHFRPEALGTFAGAGMLDPAGTDFGIRMLRGVWKYLEISAVRIAEQLEALPGNLAAAEALIDEGLIGGERPTAVDFQIGSSLHLLVRVGDVREQISPRLRSRLMDELFEPADGDVPAGAFPAGWVPVPAG